MSAAPVLEIRDLKTWFRTDRGVARAVDGVSFEVLPGETLGVVGESGCGKSVTALSVLGLVPKPPGIHAGGQILFEGADLARLGERELEDIRGDRISMIFQEPMTSLNPVFTVGDQIAESVVRHRGVSRGEAMGVAVDMLQKVGIPSPESRVRDYPHQMSGGMRQRVMIAMALACRPTLLVADEPTTALDVTIQAQILELLAQLQRDLHMSVLLITHDLGVVEEVCDRVVVMYAGKVVERATVDDLFDRPLHPYTAGLFRSVPRATGTRAARLEVIPGVVPSPLDFPTGCRFRNRCPAARGPCAEGEPPLVEGAAGHQVACHYPEGTR
ncbi:ABC transporter ATP-binding protein [Myxococcota bacterium]|nr:ABC transporter ATP-binding protein [Myxococcota bacterium]